MFIQWTRLGLTGSLPLVLSLAISACTPVASPPQNGSALTSIEITQTQPVVQAQPVGQTLPITAKVTINNQVIDLEVARSLREQSIGLMYRTSLPDNRGMLFPFQPAFAVSFWMKNTLIPLDMVFLYQGEVKAIIANVPPCKSNPCPTYGPGVPIDQVIELRAGRAEELGLKVGDRLTIQFL